MTPRVTLDGDIILDLMLDNSALGADKAVAGVTVPSFVQRTVTTRLRLRDGESNLLAGLLQEGRRTTSRDFPARSTCRSSSSCSRATTTRASRPRSSCCSRRTSCGRRSSPNRICGRSTSDRSRTSASADRRRSSRQPEEPEPAGGRRRPHPADRPRRLRTSRWTGWRHGRGPARHDSGAGNSACVAAAATAPAPDAAGAAPRHRSDAAPAPAPAFATAADRVAGHRAGTGHHLSARPPIRVGGGPYTVPLSMLKPQACRPSR